MISNKKKIIALCIAAVILSAGIGTTLAYLGASDSKENKIVVGTDVAEISEQFSEPSVQTMNNTTQKEITVKNTGNLPCFVRVYAEFSDSDISSIAKVSYDGSNYVDWITGFKDELAKSTNSISEDWYYDKGNTKLGGYFYYKKILPVGDSTPTLIKSVQVNFPESANSETNIDQIREYNMVVYTETIRTGDIDGAEFGDEDWQKAWQRFLKVQP